MSDAVPPQSSSAERTIPLVQKKKLLEVGEISNLSFWIGHFFMLLATVLGVYLAGQQGLRQAVEFEQIQSDKNNYYLRQSLHDELNDNLQLIREYTEKLSGVSISSARSQNLTLDKFVWDTMRYSPATLETPSELLGESRKFYRDVNDAYEKIRNGYFHYPEQGGKVLLEVVAHMEANVLPRFQENLSGIKAVLDKKKVSL